MILPIFRSYSPAKQSHASRMLRYPDQPFNKDDVEYFAAKVFEAWKKRYIRESDPTKMAKYKASSKKNRRKQRQRMVST